MIKERPKTSRPISLLQQNLSPSELLEDNSALIYWKLWKCAFKPEEMQKIVTMKMLSKLRSHYNKRGIFKFDHFTRFKDTKRTWKVCDLCYRIVIAEHELIRTEEKFARLQGIPIDDLSKEKVIVANDTHITSDVFKWKLKQWRLMFYLDIIKEIQLDKIVSYFKPKNGIYIQFMFANNITKFQIKYEHLLTKIDEEIDVKVKKKKYLRSFTKRNKSLNFSKDW